ncbi:hypothetical protein SDJN03_17955, partial [Cucurbita argyrosperma subsp. sororia]
MKTDRLSRGLCWPAKEIIDSTGSFRKRFTNDSASAILILRRRILRLRWKRKRIEEKITHQSMPLDDDSDVFKLHDLPFLLSGDICRFFSKKLEEDLGGA